MIARRVFGIIRPLLSAGALLLVASMPGAATAAPGPPTTTAPALPAGDWTIYANGSGGVLHIASVTESGGLSGSVFGKSIQGFWNGFGRRLTFTTTVASNELQVFTGYLVGKQPTEYVLAGELEVFGGTVGSATRNVYGWEAYPDGLATAGVVKLSAAYTSLPPMTMSINANGYQGTLIVASVDGQGNVAGTLFGNALHGLWDGYQRKLTFIRFEDMNDPTRQQLYTGYYSPGVTSILAGSFQAFAGATAQRDVFGWYATNVNILPLF